MTRLNPFKLVAALLAFQTAASPAPAPEPQPVEDVVIEGRSLNGNPPVLTITAAVSTTKWFEGTNKVQIYEATIKNTGTSIWVTKDDTLTLTVSSNGVTTVKPGTVTRLRPGDSAIVQIGVQNKAGVTQGNTGAATMIASWGGKYGKATTATRAFTATFGFGSFSATTASINSHSSPDWFNDAKYGIFIHWGVYAVPAWGNTGANEQYAEWYWYNQHLSTAKSQTYQYHLKTYGQNVVYDDFIKNFTASNFNPKDWVQLIADAGAKYFVPTTKHHDGFALFDFPISISTRSSVHLGPKRDLIKELFDAAKTYQPQLKRGTYFSLPEWFSPIYKPYARKYFAGGPAKNAYTGAIEPYTGYVPQKDFVQGIQLPQLNVLAYNYESDIMWCDIGSANNNTIFASKWLDWANSNNRQVTFNNRCGSGNSRGDFNTPEYVASFTPTLSKWEASRGMDPYSYGINLATPDSAYMTPQTIVTTLIDIVAKGGNFLLDIGPKADGTILPIEANNLRAAGTWIKAHGESIYGTQMWLISSGSGSIRYTTKPDAFYIHVLQNPGTTLTIPDPIPWLPGDTVTVVGGSANGLAVTMTQSGSQYKIAVPSAASSGDKWGWTFKISYVK